MAKKVTVSLVDDYDGESEAVETLTFGLDGTVYEVDLSETHAAGLREALRPYVACSRRVSGRRQPKPNSDNGAVDPAKRDAIKQWAQQNGHPVAMRGRIKQSVVQAFEASLKAAPPEKPAKPTRKKAPANNGEPAFSG